MNTFVLMVVICFNSEKTDCEHYMVDYDLPYTECLETKRVQEVLHKRNETPYTMTYTCKGE